MGVHARKIGAAAVAMAFAIGLLSRAVADDKAVSAKASAGKRATAEQLEFFEKKVRPILARRCYSCHSGKAKKLQGGLRLDSRAAAIRGGDTGPAIQPGNPKESLLIDAVNYGDLYQMPPKSKLPADEIAALTRWVRDGAVWPADAAPGVARPEKTFNLADRKRKHWAWSPVQDPPLPAVRNPGWARDPLDRFILARLDAAGLTPAPQADRRTLIRRATYDLIGLPPTPAEVRAFLEDNSPQAFARVVDRLLKSPHFGERWGRHWLDLVRYAESRGHEFDYSAPNAHEYRDYVIRALNADVPYDRFVAEHVAGDLLQNPRRHPTKGFNESVLGTGFWFLGEWVHSPVDIRKDETERFDNMVDVFSKTFLGLTVACARCHDHKFDAISQRDYYALFGFLQSSAYRQVRFESLDQNQDVAKRAAALRAAESPQIASKTARAYRQVATRLESYLTRAGKLAGQLKVAKPPADIVFADFESGSYDGWKVEGNAFGDKPQTLQTIAKYQGKINARGKFFVNSHNVRGGRKGDRPMGRMLSRSFTVELPVIELWVGGGAHAGKTCVNLLLGDKVVRTATGRNNNQMHLVRWDVKPFRGKTARIEIVDRVRGGWGNIGVDHIVFKADEGTAVLTAEARKQIAAEAATAKLDPAVLQNWVERIWEARRTADSPLHAWSLAATGKRTAAEAWLQKATVASAAAKPTKKPAGLRVITDFTQAGDGKLLQDGVVFGVRAQSPGELIFADPAAGGLGVNVTGGLRRDPLFNDLRLASGTERDAGRLAKWDRAGRTVRTPGFRLEHGRLFFLVRGRGFAYGVVDSHRMINGPLHGSLIREFNTGGKWQWVELNLNKYPKHRAHLELTALGAEPLDIQLVVESREPPGKFRISSQSWTGSLAAGSSLTTWPSRFAGHCQQVLERLQSGQRLDVSTKAPQAHLADWMLRNPALFVAPNDPAGVDLKQSQQAFASQYEKLAKQVRHESRTALGMWDGSGEDEFLLIRGNTKTPGKAVPRRFLEAIAGADQPPVRSGSGRMELVRRMVDPRNPFVSRVVVNRIWHHLTGRGIVPSTDNFGVLGQRPSHPQLLDHLAQRFVRDGWSIKRMIRAIMLSQTYRMSSAPRADAAEVDPTNKWLHRMRIRRLQGEAIRDTLLALSGRLDKRLQGRSVPVYLTPFMQGRGRPRPGPLDGAGRRSIYISIRRNFLSPMMLAFDTPQPFNTVGRRTVSNVPAQALILMNDPLVIQQARLWAERALKRPNADTRKRIGWLYESAFARVPREEEVDAAVGFLKTQAATLGVDSPHAEADPRVWADLCHVLLNLKEFIFIQ